MSSHPRPERIDLGPVETRLPAEGPDARARALASEGVAPADVARQVPASSYAWAVLAETAMPTSAVASYAFARTGYHRGLDALRRAGWRGIGAVPVDHEPNQGFLRALLALADAAVAIGEDDEADRCTQFLQDCGTSADEVAALR